MALQSLGLGSTTNDGTGDNLRVAADKVNDNFSEIYTLIGDASSLSTGISATASVITLTTPTIATPNITGTAVMADLDISGDVDIDGTLEADAITIDGTTLAETISDTVGAMVGSNTETGITVSYDDADNTLDFVIGTLNQDTTGNAATATILETARTIGGTSFNGSANIAVALSATSTALATARTIGGTSFDGTANIAVALSATATALATARTIGGVSFDGTGNINLPGVNAAGNQDTSGTAAIATTVTITDNESTNESNAIIFTAGGDVDGGNLGLESDGTLTYNPSTGIITSTGFAGALTGNVTGNASGTAATVTGAAQTAITSVGTLTALQIDNININTNTISSTAGTDLLITPLSGQQIVLDGTIVIDAGVVTGATSITSTAFVGDITGDVTGTADVATVATTVTITDNESTNESNAIIFTAGGDVDGGNIGLESDGTLTYNPSTGKITATGFIGALTGNVTGNLAGTVSTATQNSITTATGLVSVGALDSGSITSGFTSIDTGAGTITTTGAITGGSVAGRKTIVTNFNTNSAVTASLTAAQSGATILIDGTENNVINLPNAATTNPGIYYDLVVRVAVASDKTTIVNIHGSGGNFVGALSLAGGTAANAVLDNAGDALTFVNSTVVGSRARITCLTDDATDGVWQVECLASPIATIA